jgi:hypothetical protein
MSDKDPAEVAAKEISTMCYNNEVYDNVMCCQRPIVEAMTEVIRAAYAEQTAELERFRRDYRQLEELSPPDVSRKKFVGWCFDAWEEVNGNKAELKQLRTVAKTLNPRLLAFLKELPYWEYEDGTLMRENVETLWTLLKRFGVDETNESKGPTNE